MGFSEGSITVWDGERGLEKSIFMRGAMKKKVEGKIGGIERKKNTKKVGI